MENGDAQARSNYPCFFVLLGGMTLILALVSCACGAVAAYYWYRSAMVETMPTWATGDKPDPLNEPVIKTLSQDGWIAGMVKSVSENAYWNKRAALWSAGAVIFTALSSVSSALGY
jgi:hypothetical protein